MVSMIDFFEFSNEMLCLANQEGRFTRVNDAWTKTLGWSALELTTRPYLDFVHPEDLDATMREASLLRSGNHEIIWFENRYRCLDGSYRWLAWKVSVVASENQLVCSARDITEQKTQSQALAASEQRFRQLATRAPIGIAQADAEGSIFYVNDKWCELAGVTQQEAMGFAWKEFLHSEDLPRVYNHWQSSLLAGQDMQPVEFRFLHRNGDVRWASSSSTLLKDALGNITGQIVSEQDITELKQTEQSLRSEQDLLRNVIEVQEKEKQFVCHEFHDGLIQYAVGSLMLLESCRNAPLPQAELAKIATAISNLSRGIEDGRRVIRGIRPSVLDDSGLAAAMDDLIGQFANSGIHVTSQCDPNIGRLPNEIETTVYRVVQEALNNAKKYSGTDVVRITLQKIDGNLQLEVRDFGHGFDVESARNKGFGLVGMKERVRLLGGECRVQSEQDVGTRISVRLPIPGGQ